MKSKKHHLKPGTILIDKYIVRGVLGEGGFGITYDAENQNLGMRVAIKEFYCRDYLSRDIESSDDVLLFDPENKDRFDKERRRFLEEARILMKFSNEAEIVNVIDLFDANNTAYIVMYYLDGVNLREHIRRNGPMDYMTLFKKAYPLLESLEKVHQSGLIHGDITPDNIMMLSDGSLCLIDFGASYRFDEESKSYVINVGKSGYTAPEQHSDEAKVTHKADIYSLSATLFYCLTGQDPESSVERILMAHDCLKPSDYANNIPREVDEIVITGGRLEADNRFPGILDMQREMEVIVDPPPSPFPWKKVAVAIAVLSAVIFIYMHRIELKFFNVETERLWLSPIEYEFVENYNKSSDSIRKWFDAFAGEDNYLWKEDEQSIEVEFPKSILCDYDPAYIFNKYLWNPEDLYLFHFSDAIQSGDFEATTVSVDNPVRIDRGEIESVELLSGEIEGIDRDYFGLPDSGAYKYIKVTLKDPLAENTQNKYRNHLNKTNEVMCLSYGLKDNIYYLHNLGRERYDYCVSSGDGKTFFILSPDQEGNILDMLVFSLTNESWPLSFEICEDWIVNWEDTKGSEAVGSYQVNYSELGKECDLVLCKPKDVTRGEVLHTSEMVKARLDILRIPYAIGVKNTYDDVALTIAVKSGTVSDFELELVCKGNGSFDLIPLLAERLAVYPTLDIEGLIIEYPSIHTENINASTIDGKKGIEIEWDDNNVLKRFISIWEKNGADKIALVSDDHSMRFAEIHIEDMKKYSNEEHIVFTEISPTDLTIEQLEKRGFFTLLDYLGKERTYVNEEVSSIRRTNGKQKPEEIALWDLPHSVTKKEHDCIERWKEELSDIRDVNIIEKNISGDYYVYVDVRVDNMEMLKCEFGDISVICDSSEVLEGYFDGIDFCYSLEDEDAQFTLSIAKSRDKYGMQVDSWDTSLETGEGINYSQERALKEELEEMMKMNPSISKYLTSDFSL